MTDAAFDIRKGYFEALNGAIQYEGKAVPVYSFVSPEETELAIIIGNITEIEAGNNKDRWGKTVAVNLDIQNFTKGKARVSTAAVDFIGDRIQAIIIPQRSGGGQVSAGAGWRVVSTRLETSGHLLEDTATGYLMRRIIVFSHSAKQL